MKKIKETKITKKIKEKGDKRSIKVYLILRFLVIICLIRELMNGDIQNAMLCILSLILFLLPALVEKTFKVDLPHTLEITILVFIFSAEILGEINNFYGIFKNFDDILHTINGFLSASVGFSLVYLLNENIDSFKLSPIFVSLVAFCFSMTVGVLWEFFEFFMDIIVHTDMQKDTVINNIYTVTLDATRTNTVVAVKNITDTAINGKSLGLGGYLDIGIIDTMKDLLVNFIGAVVFSVIGFFYAASKGKRQKAAEQFVPNKKSAERDYLIQAQQQASDQSQQQ